MKQPENKYDDKGRKTGLWKQSGYAGVYYIANYKKGRCHGKVLYFRKDRTLSQIRFFHNGKPDFIEISCDQLGNPCSLISISNHVITGLYIYKYKDEVVEVSKIKRGLLRTGLAYNKNL